MSKWLNQKNLAEAYALAKLQEDTVATMKDKPKLFTKITQAGLTSNYKNTTPFNPTSSMPTSTLNMKANPQTGYCLHHQCPNQQIHYFLEALSPWLVEK